MLCDSQRYPQTVMECSSLSGSALVLNITNISILYFLLYTPYRGFVLQGMYNGQAVLY